MTLTYIDFLKNEFEARKRGNHSYSLRAYARDLGLSASRLSEILSTKSGLSESTAIKIAEKIKLSEVETNLFVELVNKEHARSKVRRDQARDYLEQNHSKNSISVDGLKVISDWYYFAILSVMELDAFDGTCSWVSQRLGLNFAVTKEALKTLLNLGYIELKDGKFQLLKTNLTTSHDVMSYALRKYHRQGIQKSIDSIDDVPIEFRDITSMTMTFERERMQEAKNLIKEFRRKFCKTMEEGKKEEVYSLNIQFIPLTQRGVGK